MILPRRTIITTCLLVCSFAFTGAASFAQTSPTRPILLGLDADMSKGSASGGEAIRRGAILAIDEINANGGVLGRPLELRIADHRGNPARGKDNIEEFARLDNLVAVLGGVHTPVALAELELLHRHRLIYLGPWAAGTPIVDNGFDPNFVFRVSVRDEYAGEFLIDAALKRGFRKPGLLLWRNGWGRSNRKAMDTALARRGLEATSVEWFNSGQQDLRRELNAIHEAGADVIMLVANPAGGGRTIEQIAKLAPDRRLPIISHWGITGGRFYEDNKEALQRVDLNFLQTYSFFDPPFSERNDRFVKAYCQRFGPCKSLASIISPVGSAHAFDLVHLLVMAIQRADSADRDAVRKAMEELSYHEGLVRNYAPPFSPDRHDALDASDFRLCRFDAFGAITPVR